MNQETPSPNQKPGLKNFLLWLVVILVITFILLLLLWIRPFGKNDSSDDFDIMATYPGKIVYTNNTSQDKTPYQIHCQNQAGIFHECGNICEPDAETCVQACAFTCEISENNTSDQSQIFLIRKDNLVPNEACDMPLEPFMLSISKNDPDVLKKTINQLLEVRVETNSEKNLYNALHDSDLTLESLFMSDGKVTLNLSGELVYDRDACDKKYIRAQLQRTLLQFPEIDSVEIFVNTQPLEEIMDLHDPEPIVDFDQAEALPPGTFTHNEDSLPFGEIYVRGYGTIETRKEPFCEENCAEHEYVFFHITQKSQNPDFTRFLSSQRGNSFLGPGKIGLGCKVNQRIEYINDFHNGEKTVRKEWRIEPENAEKIFSATEENPVTLRLHKKLLVLGSGAPSCYSHFTDIEVLD